MSVTKRPDRPLGLNWPVGYGDNAGRKAVPLASRSQIYHTTPGNPHVRLCVNSGRPISASPKTTLQAPPETPRARSCNGGHQGLQTTDRTQRTRVRRGPAMSDFGGKADVPHHLGECPLVARSSHSQIPNLGLLNDRNRPKSDIQAGCCERLF